MLSPIVGREMIKAGGGKIINLASQAGVIALNRHVAYCSSNGGIMPGGSSTRRRSSSTAATPSRDHQEG